MKSTGVVRRIDDLGRIVIPKEIRRSLRIRDGEPLEIFVDRETIGLKKFSSIKEMNELAKSFISIVNTTIGKNIFVSDRDSFMAISGELKDRYLNKSISGYLENVMNSRKTIIEKDFTKLEVVDGHYLKCAYVIYPIIMNGDAIGLVIVLSTKDKINKTDEKIANVTARFLGEYVEQ